jgi:Ca2+/Na+ antiporter
MAIGTSAPELFTSIIGVFISEDDIGTGTILGTAVFNLIVIPAACGFTVIAFRPKSCDISAFPILRDSIFYILTIITLILCIKDNEVDWLALRLIFQLSVLLN